jgi:negative regulator of flagellin synthesis FlgM
MNINRINPLEAVNQAAKNDKVQHSAKSERPESISVSEQAREVAELRRVRDLALTAPDREDKIAEIKAKLNDPNYINEKLIGDTADRIIEFYRL